MEQSIAADDGLQEAPAEEEVRNIEHEHEQNGLHSTTQGLQAPIGWQSLVLNYCRFCGCKFSTVTRSVGSTYEIVSL